MIVLPVDCISFYNRIEKTPEAWRIKKYEIYYDIETSDNFGDDIEILDNNIRNSPFRIYNYYIKGESEKSCNRLGWGTNYNSKNRMNADLTGKVTAKRHMSDFGIDKVQLNLVVLREINEFAKAKKIKIIYITSPAYKSYIENLLPDQLNNTSKYINELLASNPNSRYYNFLRDTSFKAEDFYDGNHLDDIGAKKLSLKVDSIIN